MGDIVSDEFTVAGRDLEVFATEWFEHLKNGGGEMRGLLDEVEEDMADVFLMGNIAPRAAKPDASEEELLFFAVLAAAQKYLHDNNKRAVLDNWEDRWDYICAAFSHVQTTGEKEIALMLAKDAMKGLQNEPEGYRKFSERFWSKRTDAEKANHERLMASIRQREFRAAKLLDPDIDLEAVMLSMPLSEED